MLCFGRGLCQNETATSPRLTVISRISIAILNIDNLDRCCVVIVYIELKKNKERKITAMKNWWNKASRRQKISPISTERVGFRLRYPVITSRMNNIDRFDRLQQKCLFI